jgi:imidazolonepropionase-like amidohydrolase
MTIVLRCGKLFDGTGTPPVDNATVTVDAGRITAIGRGTDAPLDTAATVLDLSDKFVMPGLIDAHSHASIVPGDGDQSGQMRQPVVRQALRAAANLRRDLAAGTTTMRLMAEENFLDIDLREAIELGTIPGPRLLCATRGMTASNGHGRAISTFDGVDEMRRGARQNFARGADHLKLFATGGVSSPGSTLTTSGYSRHEIAAAVEEAERVGSYVAAHAHGGPGLRIAVEEGVATIEHGQLASDEDVALMIDRKVHLICTFSILFHPTGIEQGDARNAAIMAKVHAARLRANANFPSVLKSGVRFAVGTDSMHGLMPFELQTLVRMGVSASDALLAGTRWAAEACRVADDTGSLEVGKRADILALDADPFQDMRALERVALVMTAGRVFEPGSTPLLPTAAPSREIS